MVEDALAELQDEKDNIPSKDVITTESKDEVVELLDIIKNLLRKFSLTTWEHINFSFFLSQQLEFLILEVKIILD